MGRQPRAGAGFSAESAELRNAPFVPDDEMAAEVCAPLLHGALFRLGQRCRSPVSKLAPAAS